MRLPRQLDLPGTGQPSDRMVDAYRDAVLYLDAVGLLAAPRIAEMQIMWRRGGADRDLVCAIASGWEVSA